MTSTAKHVTQRRDPTPVLRQAVQTAQRRLLLSDRDLADVNEALASLFAELAPIHDQLAAAAAAAPGGPLAAVLDQLRVSFGHAVDGRPEPAINGVITAATTAIRLADAATLEREYADAARWR
ncbi:hypothetical protein [Actinophytocola algeriensis]|uniref:Uncharacterized protein n=1 Tax=Actinophytocola algeriensis TaxID=1768010 RepID=A0A7W7VGY9_9PSEU|nr:hypothetical protein [Actinophytocola algeriensis]MBB4909540.1 hypothetical protein [Actinophytocola algeriensis]MBE1475530.1 hypothetical protein [Actinophytocola algeriensis]